MRSLSSAVFDGEGIYDEIFEPHPCYKRYSLGAAEEHAILIDIFASFWVEAFVGQVYREHRWGCDR